MKRNRRRGVLMLSLALASGGLAASEVGSRTRAVEQQVGPLVPIVVARTHVDPGSKLKPGQLGVAQVPARYAPPDALADPAEADGLRTGGALEPGSYVTASALATAAAADSRPGGGLGRGERAIELAVAGGDALQGFAGPGARVDVVVTTEGRAGTDGQTQLALADVELLALRDGADAGAVGGADKTARATATLRVTLKQAIYLTSAQNFAREIRLLPRPASG
ncbi:MAG: pilus assembly protein CpaB [Thermoleophilales bacterium]|nr:pilus assembly protein CpaB [Thermoleophilales bacterium]